MSMEIYVVFPAGPHDYDLILNAASVSLKLQETEINQCSDLTHGKTGDHHCSSNKPVK